MVFPVLSILSFATFYDNGIVELPPDGK